VEKDRLQYYNKQYLFGETVAQAFPSSAYDIAEAGNCLAVECNTAAVFHLMRVAEYGLRALAFDRRIKIPKGRPIELAAWDDILKELEKAEDEIKNYRRTLAREAQFEFHHGAMMQFKRFKNVFRNRIMHTRESFDRHQALSVLEQVREFMTILSRHIAEGKRTPKVWRGKKWAADA
jgi:hypothetical protein